MIMRFSLRRAAARNKSLLWRMTLSDFGVAQKHRGADMVYPYDNETVDAVDSQISRTGT